jgi:hypothetical protein
VFREYLDLRLQHRIMQTMVVDDSSSHEPGPGCEGACAEHECPTRLAERIGHGLSRRSRLGLGEDRQVVLASCEAGVGVERGKIGREHRCGDLAAVCAVTDKGAHESGRFQRLLYVQRSVYALEWEGRIRTIRWMLTITIWMAPQAQVAEASSSFDQPSLVWPWHGNASGFSAAVDIARGSRAVGCKQEGLSSKRQLQLVRIALCLNEVCSPPCMTNRRVIGPAPVIRRV